ncbi:MAG: hypothetical protein QG621_38 [Patescibacteria group bacterium]|nr:hypothetical protein [Patescibacteria group bacterium]
MLDLANFPLLLSTLLLLINLAGGVLLAFLVQKVHTNKMFSSTDRARAGALVAIAFVNFAMWAASILELKLIFIILSVGIFSGAILTPLLFPTDGKRESSS